MAENIVQHAKENGHWYDKSGNPAYTIVGKNGKERNTTLRDAKVLGLLPSVTSIIRLAAAPGLQRWLNEQLLLAALTSTRQEGEEEQAYIDRIIEEAGEQSKKARERGTLIHAYVQSGFEGATLDAEAYKYYISASNTLEDTFNNKIVWQCEKPFATERYGGKIDLISDEYIIDIKTTSKELGNIKLWDEHFMQLAAYDFNKDKKCGILYINTETAESQLIMATEEELNKGWDCFSALLDFYYAKTGLEA